MSINQILKERTSTMQTSAIRDYLEERVDLRTGKVVLDHTDFEWSGELMPVSIHHVYNSALSDVFYTRDADERIADFSGMKLGYGWRLNIMQSMMPASVTYEGETYNGFTYVDGDGNVTEFIPADNVNEFKAVNDDEAIYNSLSGVLTLGGYAYTFYNGRLTRIADANNPDVYTIIVYNGKRIKSVVDSVGRTFHFEYDTSGRLSSIEAPDESMLEFSYNGTDSGNSVNENTLNCIIRYGSIVDDAGDYSVGYVGATYFAYDTSSNNCNLKYCACYNGSESLSVIQKDYTYSNSAKLLTNLLKHSYTDGDSFTLGTKYRYTYNVDHTIVTVIEPSESNDISESIKTVYVFDENDNILSSHAILGESDKAEHRGGTTPFNPYHTNEAFVGFATQNLISDPSFKSSSKWEREFEDEIAFSENCVCKDESNAYFGERSLEIVTTDPNGFEEGYVQEISSLPAGTYTFSAYVKVTSDFNFTANTAGLLSKGVYLGVMNGQEQLNVSESVGSADMGFSRIGVTFTLEQAGYVALLIRANGAGTAYVSAPQLERSEWYNEVNLLENGSLDNLDGWSSGGTVYTGANDGFGDTGCINFSASSPINSFIKQTYYPKNDASIAESFVFSAWGKSLGTDSNTVFRLCARMNYSDNTFEDFEESFNNTSTWNKSELYITKSKFVGVSSIELTCEFSNSARNCYIDDLSLVRVGIERNLTADDFATYDDTEDVTVNTEEAETYVTTTDRYGNVISETIIGDSSSGALYKSFDYSSDGNHKIAETDNRGNITRFTYDDFNSRIVSVKDRMGSSVKYEYNADGKVSKATVYNNGLETSCYSEYEYDSNGNLSNIVYQRGTNHENGYLNCSFEYNDLGMLVSANGTISYDYRANSGRLKSITYANGWTVRLSYDRFGRINAEKWYKGAGQELTYEYRYVYDKSGNLVRSIDKTANKDYTYSYQDGNLARITECDIILTNDGEVISRVPVNTICYVYGNDGSLEKKVYSKAKLTAEYSSTDNTSTVVHTAPILVEEDEVESIRITEVDTVTTTTDALGRITNERVVHNGTTVISKSLEYHAGAIGEEQVNKGTPTTTLVSKITEGNRSFEYTYDKEERITSYIDSRGFNHSYTYDFRGNLIREVDTNGITACIYDDAGNVSEKGDWDEEANAFIINDNYISLAYWSGHTDRLSYVIKYKNGNRIDYFIHYDDMGNPTSHKGNTLVWEKGRQLKKYSKHHFEYNANGIRTARYFDTNVDGETVQVRYDYELEGSKVVRMLYRDRLGAENILIPLYDSADSPIGIIYNNVPYWFVKNLQGDVLALKDKTGFETVRYVYDAWGNVTVQRDRSGVDLADINPFRYRGYLYDYEFGLYYLQSRYYDPELCRFINADEPVMLNVSKSIIPNLYTYCDNDPVNHSDVTGHAIETVADIISIVWSSADLIASPSWVNLGLLAWDIASAFVPFLPGSYVTKGGKVVKFFATKADDFAEGADFLIDSYRELKKFYKGMKNIEIHHIIEKRFKKLFKGIDIHDYISVALDKQLHKEITKRWRKNFKYGTKYSNITKSQMRNAIKDVYKDMPELMDIALDWFEKCWKK
ncbi:MAG: hypothetical protein IKV53_07540 [Clostridia bacterium]|nr:hypothetical protein [Clostridia bacterium]